MNGTSDHDPVSQVTGETMFTYWMDRLLFGPEAPPPLRNTPSWNVDHDDAEPLESP